MRDIADAYREYLQVEGKRYDRDRYRIEAIVEHFGPATDPTAITKAAYREWCDRLRREGKAPATILRNTNTLLAILNGARKDDLIREHQLSALRKPRVRMTRKPEVFTRHQVGVLLGPAIDAWECEQARRGASARMPDGKFAGGSRVALRGLCLVAYYTLMRPGNNFGLTWEQLWIDPSGDRGTFRLERHKNASKGVNVEGALHPELVRYLRPLQGRGLVHPNPETGVALRNIRAAWTRLLEIADGMLGDGEKLRGADFYRWRHTGASHLAEASGNPVLVARMMGDTSLRTVMNHYFDSSLEHMGEIVEKWARPRVE